MKDSDCVDLLRWALPRMGFRWEGFRKPRGQVCKRIGRRVAELGLEGPAEYRRLLADRPEEWEALAGLCRVTISRFFRDRGVWEHMGERALPELAAEVVGAELRAWSAGCASGEEPYSLSILWGTELAERFPGVELRIVATDADETVLERARRGCYGPGTLKEMDEARIRRAFRRDPARAERGGEPLCLRPEFREPVELRLEDVRERMPEGPFHLVLCRNLVFTYFEWAEQARLLERLLARLVPGGRLVLGAHETLPDGDWPLEEDTGAEPVWLRRHETP